jgi:hypothetical protein
MLPKQNALRAELIGTNRATCRGVTVTGRHAPVLSLCRALIEAGHDPVVALEAYRGNTLCLRVRSLAEGAAVEQGPAAPEQDGVTMTDELRKANNSVLEACSLAVRGG